MPFAMCILCKFVLSHEKFDPKELQKPSFATCERCVRKRNKVATPAKGGDSPHASSSPRTPARPRHHDAAPTSREHEDHEATSPFSWAARQYEKALGERVEALEQAVSSLASTNKVLTRRIEHLEAVRGSPIKGRAARFSPAARAARSSGGGGGWAGAR